MARIQPVLTKTGFERVDQVVTPELVSFEPKGHRLSPEEVGLLAKKLANARHANEALRLRESMIRGFYGI
jgi:hypothetical protein